MEGDRLPWLHSSGREGSSTRSTCRAAGGPDDGARFLCRNYRCRSSDGEGNVTSVGKQAQGGSGDLDGRPVNEIRLCGRLAAAPSEKVLPSGDPLVTFRLVVPRPVSRRRGPAGGRVPSVDTIDCSAWSAALRRRVVGWESGDLITVEGALRRRFWHASGGARSRYDVEVLKASRRRRGS